MIICDVSGSAYNCSAEYMVDNNKATFFLILFGRTSCPLIDRSLSRSLSSCPAINYL